MSRQKSERWTPNWTQASVVPDHRLKRRHEVANEPNSPWFVLGFTRAKPASEPPLWSSMAEFWLRWERVTPPSRKERLSQLLSFVSWFSSRGNRRHSCLHRATPYLSFLNRSRRRLSILFFLFFLFLQFVKGPASALCKGSFVLTSFGEILQRARERRAFFQQDQFGRERSRALWGRWLRVIDMASIYTQGWLGLSHGLSLEWLDCRIGSREGRCDLASFIAEGALVSENFCGVLAGEHCGKDGKNSLIQLNKDFFHTSLFLFGDKQSCVSESVVWGWSLVPFSFFSGLKRWCLGFCH